MKRCVVAVLAALFAVPLAAQERPRPGGAGARPREELYRMIDAYIFSTLQESLGLSDDQFVHLMPLVKRFQFDRRRFVETRNETIRDMRGLLESGHATEARLADLLRTLKRLEDEEPGVLRKDMELIDSQLSPLQQAKLRILQQHVDQKLRDLMGRVRQQGPNRNKLRPDDEPPP